jgi:dTDP-N-acetylfucosamine:lipid II N-acetylfucosaminyltransferase
MNLHIVPDNVFINQFYDNLAELGLLESNRIIVRSNYKKLKYIRRDISFAPLYSTKFSALTGETSSYDRVFIHQLSPLMYRWIARHDLKELNWMVWGADLYNLRFTRIDLHEKLTNRYVKKVSAHEVMLQLKYWLTNAVYRDKAYAKIKNVLTWMESEYAFARNNIPSLKGGHRFFFYENQIPYQKIDASLRDQQDRKKTATPSIIIGNSGGPDTNHLDAMKYLDDHGIKADLTITVSYGTKDYIDFLKKNVGFYKNGKVEFLESYMGIEDYLNFLATQDGLVMYNIRPQGFGNIFMMLYLGKPVFLHEKNISIPDLEKNGIQWYPLSSISDPHAYAYSEQNREAVVRLLSHERLLGTYRELFG